KDLNGMSFTMIGMRHSSCQRPRRYANGPRTPSMSAFGPKRTCRKTQLMSLLGVKRTWVGAVHMSAFDPKRTLITVQDDLSKTRHFCHQHKLLRGGAGHHL